MRWGGDRGVTRVAIYNRRFVMLIPQVILIPSHDDEELSGLMFVDLLLWQ